jgi:hypothetical protein
MGLEKELNGVIDLVDERAIYFDGDYGYFEFKNSVFFLLY